jgi:4-hydroxyphenylpyruvate dioxygenase-like putative hemolysin
MTHLGAPSDLLVGFDHLEFWVGNAFQTANYLTTRFGFKHIAYRGLETGSRDLVTHVVSQGQVRNMTRFETGGADPTEQIN